MTHLQMTGITSWINITYQRVDQIVKTQMYLLCDFNLGDIILNNGHQRSSYERLLLYKGMYTYIYVLKKRKKFNHVLVNKFYYYNYSTTKIFDDPVAFLSGTMYVYIYISIYISALHKYVYIYIYIGIYTYQYYISIYVYIYMFHNTSQCNV